MSPSIKGWSKTSQRSWRLGNWVKINIVETSTKWKLIVTDLQHNRIILVEKYERFTEARDRAIDLMGKMSGKLHHLGV